MCHICEKVYCQGSTLSKHLKKVHSIELTSGHSRFRYKLEADGFYRLQTMRYESLELFELLNKKDPSHVKSAISEEINSNSDCTNIETTDVTLVSSTDEIPVPETNNSIDFNQLIYQNNLLKPQKVIFNVIESMEKELVCSSNYNYESSRTPTKSSNLACSSEMCDFNPDNDIHFDDFDTNQVVGDVNQSFLMQLETPKKIDSSARNVKTTTYDFFLDSSEYE